MPENRELLQHVRIGLVVPQQSLSTSVRPQNVGLPMEFEQEERC